MGFDLVEGELPRQISYREFSPPLVADWRIEEMEEVAREIVGQERVQFHVDVLGNSRFIMHRGGDHVKIGCCDLIEQRKGLTGVDQHDHLAVHTLHIHLIDDFGQVLRVNQFSVRNFKEILSTMTVPVHKDAGVSIRLETL